MSTSNSSSATHFGTLVNQFIFCKGQFVFNLKPFFCQLNSSLCNINLRKNFIQIRQLSCGCTIIVHSIDFIRCRPKFYSVHFMRLLDNVNNIAIFGFCAPYGPIIGLYIFFFVIMLKILHKLILTLFL